MATAQDIIIRARQALRIHAEEESLQAYEAERGLSALRSMLGQWKLDKTIKGYVVSGLADQVSVDVRNEPDATPELLTLTDEADTALIYNLAVVLSSMYGIEADPVVLAQADLGRSSISALDLNNADNRSQFDIALLTTNSRHRYG